MAEKKKEVLGCNSVAKVAHANARDTFYRPKKHHANRRSDEPESALQDSECALKNILSSSTRITVNGELTFEFLPASASSHMQILSPETAFSLHCMAQPEISCDDACNTNIPDTSAFILRRDVIDSYLPRIF